jgi:hypothetical protein
MTLFHIWLTWEIKGLRSGVIYSMLEKGVWIKFHIGDQHILGATVQNLVAGDQSPGVCGHSDVRVNLRFCLCTKLWKYIDARKQGIKLYCQAAILDGMQYQCHAFYTCLTPPPQFVKMKLGSVQPFSMCCWGVHSYCFGNRSVFLYLISRSVGLISSNWCLQFHHCLKLAKKLRWIRLV